MDEIKWIFFDIGGVLGDESRYLNWRMQNDLEAVRKSVPETGLQDIAEAWPQASARQGDLDENVVSVLVTDKAAAAKALDYLRKAKKEGPGYYDWLLIRPEADGVLAALSQKYNLGIMANQNPIARQKLEKAGVLGYFAHAGMSGDYGWEKPDPRLFQEIFLKTGAIPAESVLIDDNAERGLATAKEFGMTAVWYRLEDANEPGVPVDYIISSLPELLDIF